MSTMTAPAANFIPLARRRAREVRIMLRRIAVAGAAYLVLLGCGLFVAAASLDTDRSAIDRKLDDLAAVTNAQQSEVTSLENQNKSRRRRLEANRAVSVQPDWSVLLLELPQWIGDQSVIRRISITRDPEPAPGPKDSKEAKPAPPKPRGFKFALSALATSQEAPARAVMAMEAAGVFDQVKVAQTRRETIGSVELVAFDIEGRLADARESP